ncbi:response regulator [Desulfobacterales bacterium HSG17]|nr:response regulator [Desulfobacterales bacterium HSG17]
MKKTIITVDDSKSIRQMLSFTFKEAGYEVIEAVDGINALEKIKGTQIHLMIVDLNMPNMNGIQLIRAVRSDPDNKFMPILILTTESQESIKQEGRKVGATGWVVKPYKPEQLLAVAKRLLN